MSLNVGDTAPDFKLSDAEGRTIEISNLLGKWVVLYFYPRDNTPGCTKEACGFRDIYADYQGNDVLVLGVSTDDAKTHTKCATKHSLPFPLLVDEEGKAASAYGSYGPKKFMGKEYVGITRSTFVIDPEGKLAKIYRKVKPEPHAKEVLSDISDLKASSQQ
jgi:peroxiredoxin Q/BCP